MMPGQAMARGRGVNSNNHNSRYESDYWRQPGGFQQGYKTQSSTYRQNSYDNQYQECQPQGGRAQRQDAYENDWNSGGPSSNRGYGRRVSVIECS